MTAVIAVFENSVANLRLALPALQVRAFRRFLVEDSLGGMGQWVLTIAIAWTMLERTGSGTVVGLLQTMVLVPIPVAIAVGGILTDRYGPRLLMYVSWTGAGAAAVFLAIIESANLLTVPSALIVMLVSGFFIGLYVVPAQVFVARCVEPATMANAIGLSQLTVGVGRILGGWAAGVVLVLAGPGRSFFVSAAAFLAAALVCVTLPSITGPERRIGNPWRGINLAIHAVASSRTMSAVLVIGSTSAVFVYCYLALTPLVVRHLIGGGATRLGLLTAAGGVGAITAALFMDAVGRTIGRGRLLLVSLLTSGTCVAVLGLSRWTILSFVIAFFLSASTVTLTASSVLLLQASSELSVRGRVMALFNGLFYVLLPCSEALAGFASDRLSVTTVLVGAGSVATVFAVAMALLNHALTNTDVDGTGHIVGVRRAQPSPAAAGELPSIPFHHPVPPEHS